MQTIPFYSSYDGNYYKTLVKELSSDIWEFINEDQNKLASIQVFYLSLFFTIFVKQLFF